MNDEQKNLAIVIVFGVACVGYVTFMVYSARQGKKFQEQLMKDSKENYPQTFTIKDEAHARDIASKFPPIVADESPTIEG